MQRVKTASAVTSKPAYVEGGTTGFFTAGDAVAGIPATVPGAQWFNQVQEELLNAIKAGGLTPDATQDNQLAAAIAALIAANTVEVEPATETVAGILRFATAAEALAGLLTNVGMSPATSLAQVLAQIVANRVLGPGFRNLLVWTTGTSAAVSLTADSLVVETSAGIGMLLRNLALSADLVTANLDTGSLAANTWYYPWIFAKADGTAILRFSLSATAPAVPAGYTHKARVGALRTDGTANMYPLHYFQRGRTARYVVAATGNVTALPMLASGQLGAVANTYVPIGVDAFIPPTGIAVDVTMGSNGGTLILSPSPAYGMDGNTTNPSPWEVSAAGNSRWAGRLILESRYIYYASNYSLCWVACMGWEDSI